MSKKNQMQIKVVVVVMTMDVTVDRVKRTSETVIKCTLVLQKDWQGSAAISKTYPKE